MLIIENRKARFDFYLEEYYQAGMVLEGWEIKALRAGRAQLRDCHVIFKHQEAYLLGAVITPLPSASTHFFPDSQRTRKLLLQRSEIQRLQGKIERKGFTCVATKWYWKQRWIKCEVALARGKKLYDKRQTIREREWQRAQKF